VRAEHLGWPVVCKPVCGGSSIGVTVCRSRAEAIEGIERAFQARGAEGVLVERYVRGRELTAAVLDGRALPLVEIRPRQAFFDYNAKYEDSSTLYLLDVPLPRAQQVRLQEIGVRAYEALGCRHMGRTDLILGQDGRPYVLEVNTIPGCTSRSLLPKAAAAAGIDFPRLCDELVSMALRDAGRLRKSAA
jgi:D-alanine--D-alanine ligase